MSMYNLMHGTNPATFFILPMLGEKHPDEYPRFRDCFVMDEEQEIHVFTRVGGGNRNCGYGEEKLREHENFLRDFDSEEDSTYATYVFSVPDEWKEDFKKIMDGDLKNVSPEYQKRVKIVYPKLKEKLELLWK